MAEGKVRFIRKNGRVIPIRGARPEGKSPKARLVQGRFVKRGALERVENGMMNGFKVGALVGGTLGGIAGAVGGVAEGVSKGGGALRIAREMALGAGLVGGAGALFTGAAGSQFGMAIDGVFGSRTRFVKTGKAKGKR